jgi:hypothetical protein
MTDQTPQRVVYPALDLSKSQFRLLFLHSGLYEDEIKAQLLTVDLPALPLSFEDEAHFTLLDEVYEALSIAVSQDSGIRLAEILRWQRLHDELDELYMNRSLAELQRCGKFDPYCAPKNIEIQADDATRTLRKRKDSFISLVEEYQRTSSYPLKTADFQASISHLQSEWHHHSRFAPDYEAVSYFCGNQTIKVQIVMNDNSVSVPANAAHALRGLRSKDKMRMLWIDALCIDQGNDIERAHQVLQLAKIYSSATRTLAWLGEEDETLAESFSTCFDRLRHAGYHELSHMPKGAKLISRHQGVEVFSVPAPKDQPPSFVHAQNDAVSAIVLLLAKYLTRPWFNRLWMYQEVLLAQECVCCVGAYELAWSYVQRALLSLSRVPLETSNVGEFGLAAPWTRTMYTLSPFASNANTALSLRELLLETMPLNCSNDRDKVYALLGLTRWSKRRETIPLEIWPDYTKSVTECMRDATYAVIREDASLECLILRTLTGPKPTWMIPWHQQGDKMGLLDFVEYKAKGKSHFDCSKGLTLDCDNMRLPQNPDSLFVRGLRFRKIATVSPVSSKKDVQDTYILSKLKILLKRIDSSTNCRMTQIDAGVLRDTICRNLHNFVPTQWRSTGGGLVFHLKTLSSRGINQHEQGKNCEVEQCTENGFPEVKEAGVRFREEGKHEESGSDQKEGRHSSVDHVQNALEEWWEAQLVNTSGIDDTTTRPPPRGHLSADEDIRASSHDAPIGFKMADLLLRAIKTLQDKWHSNSSIHNDTSEIKGVGDITDEVIHLGSCLDHCLTKSRFYIPAPDWSETTPVELSIGIGPAEMEPGDQVVILFGCKHPVILRSEGSSWLYVGPAYAHEMMTGDFVNYWEFFRKQGFTGVASEVFEIQ